MRAISPTAALRAEGDNFGEQASMLSKNVDEKAKAF
jgi:hypothetical protein